MGISFLFSFAFSFFSFLSKASSDNHFAFLHFFLLGMVLIPASCTMSQTSIWRKFLEAACLSDLIPWIYLSLPLYNRKGYVLGHTWMSSGFSFFLQFKSQFGNEEFMIRSTVSSQSCFCWLYTASLSLAAKNIINLISVLPSGDVHVYSLLLCRWKRLFATTSVFFWQNSVSFALLCFVLQGQIFPLLQIFLDFLLLLSSAL